MASNWDYDRVVGGLASRLRPLFGDEEDEEEGEFRGLATTMRDRFGGFRGLGTADRFQGLGGGLSGIGRAFGGLTGATDRFEGLGLGLAATVARRDQERAEKEAAARGVQVGPGVSHGDTADARDNAGLTGDRIDQWIRTTNAASPIAGLGGYILDAANRHGVSAPLLLGIFLKESSLGTTAGSDKNLAGLTDPNRDQGLGGVRAFIPNATWEEAIDRAAANLGSSLYRGKSLADQVGAWYVGPGAYAKWGLDANDTGGRGPGGNGTVRDYLSGPVARAYSGLGVTRGGASADVQGLVAKAQPFMGSAYTNAGIRVSGNPRDGFDCSSLTGYLLGLDRSRWNAQIQADTTVRVNAQDVRPGDLVFFQGTNANDPSARPVSHVGIYLGGGRMLHAGTNGVEITDLNTPYWQSHLWGYGRTAGAPPGGPGPRS